MVRWQGAKCSLLATAYLEILHRLGLDDVGPDHNYRYSVSTFALEWLHCEHGRTEDREQPDGLGVEVRLGLFAQLGIVCL
jgi:hypothetical protein